MKTNNNFFHSAPAWISNSLAAVLTLLITINQIGPQIADIFDILNCQKCIDIVQKVLTVAAILLSILKIIKRRKPDGHILDVLQEKRPYHDFLGVYMKHIPPPKPKN